MSNMRRRMRMRMMMRRLMRRMRMWMNEGADDEEDEAEEEYEGEKEDEADRQYASPSVLWDDELIVHVSLYRSKSRASSRLAICVVA